MKQIYYEKGEGANSCIADVITCSGTAFPGNWRLITRISTTPGMRGQGAAGRVMRAICAEADREKVILMLEVAPSGPLDYATLEAWYKRLGFQSGHKGQWGEDIMVRLPR